MTSILPVPTHIHAGSNGADKVIDAKQTGLLARSASRLTRAEPSIVCN